MENTILTQPQKIEFILNKGCEYFGLDREVISQNNIRGKSQWEKKRYFAPILYEHTAATLNEIATLLGFKDHSSVIYHMKKINEELSDAVYGSKKTRVIYKELLAYINLEENETT